MPMGTERNVWIASEGSLFVQGDGIKKESPNEGTETTRMILTYHVLAQIIKKESPNEGTETPHDLYRIVRDPFIKKESPNEGAEKTMME